MKQQSQPKQSSKVNYFAPTANANLVHQVLAAAAAAQIGPVASQSSSTTNAGGAQMGPIPAHFGSMLP